MRETTTALEPHSHHQQQHAHRVQHVYAFDVAELSERLGVSQQELVDGIARDHDHIALQQMLERATKSSGELLQQQQQQHDAADKLQHTSPESRSGSDDGADDVKICREACLLLLPSSKDTRRDQHSLSPVLQTLEDGRTVLEHVLHELFQPKLIDHLVVCLPSQQAQNASHTQHTKLKKLGSRLGAMAKVRVDFVEIEGGESEVRAVQTASRCFTRDADRYTHRSDGFLVLRGDRIFDAPTIRMMAVATAAASSPAAGTGAGGKELRIRALVDFDVELSEAPEDEMAAPFAGIFAFIGKPGAIADRFEHKDALRENQQQQPTAVPAMIEELLVSAARNNEDDDSVRAVSIEKVVASDYCNWRKVDDARESSESNQARVQPVTRHTLSSFHSNPPSKSKRQQSVRSSSSEQSFEYFEFPRERSSPLSHGYHGFRVETKHAAVTGEPESTQAIGQSTSEHNALLSKTEMSSGVSNSYDYGYDYDGGNPEDVREFDEHDLEFGVETTVLTEADIDALLEAKNQAFLFQVGPDHSQQPQDASPSNTNRSIFRSQLDQKKHQDDGVVFLALPEQLQVDKHDHRSATGVKAPQHLRLRRFSQLPSDVQEIKMEAVVLPQSHALLLPEVKIRHASGAVAVNVVVKKQVPVVGYVILLTALCAISSQGAVQDLLVGVPPLLKVFWRMTGASLAFSPLALASLQQNSWVLPVLPARKKALLALCGVSYAIYNATFIIALSLTSVGHTYIFTNCHSLLMVLLKLVLGQPLGILELVGAGVGFSGGVITTLDHSAAGVPSLGHPPSTLGDMIAFGGAFAGVAYLMSAKRVRPTMGVFVFMWTLVTAVAMLVGLVLLWNREALGITHGVFWSTDATHGLLGWTHHLGIEAYVVLVGSFAGTMGFITSLKYFDPLVVSVTMLTEPVVATVFGICVGVDELPGALTFLGGLAVLLGCGLVMLATHRTSAKVDVSDALVVPAGAAQRLEAISRRRHSTMVHSQQQQQRINALRVNYGSFP